MLLSHPVFGQVWYIWSGKRGDSANLREGKSYVMRAYIYIYPGTQMTLVLTGKGLVFGGLTFKNRGHLGSRYIYIYTYLSWKSSRPLTKISPLEFVDYKSLLK